MMKSILAALLLGLVAMSQSVAQSVEEADREQIIAIMEGGPLHIGVETDLWEQNFHPDWTVWFAGNEATRDRALHMPAVHDYVASGAVVVAYEFDLVSLDLFEDIAVVRYNAIEHIREGDGNMRVVPYSGNDTLVREGDRWLIRTSSLSFPARYRDVD